ncbi:hypothetical protein C8R45DRAFT_331772 [Mycena sanguinolenta]|nr:hypothetical protein C8R45DRAFT_331772 [Mycena sanguinolenta]
MDLVPNDILLELFLSFVDPSISPWITLRPLMQVCSRWRSMVLASPLLWRNVVVDGRAGEMREIPLQLERSGRIPLSIRLDTNYEDEHCKLADALDLLLGVSERWQNVSFVLGPKNSKHLFASTCTFPILNKVSLRWNPEDTPAADVDRFFETLPQLEDLCIDSCSGGQSFSHLTLPWSGLRGCVVHPCDEEQLLRILPVLSPRADFSCTIFNAPLDISVGNVHTPVRVFTVSVVAQQSISVVLRSLTARLLEELTIDLWTYGDCGSLALEIISFLSRSACALTSLRLRLLTLDEQNMLAILELPECDSIVLLEFDRASNAFIDALTTSNLVPNLETLVLPGYQSPWSQESSLLMLVESRRPVLRSLHIDNLSAATVLALRADGIEVTSPY